MNGQPSMLKTTDCTAPRSLDRIIPSIEDIRASLITSARRLRRAQANGDTLTPSALYREISDMRACAQEFTNLVNDMCRHAFPLRLDPQAKAVLQLICDRGPVPKLLTRMQMAHMLKSTDAADAVIAQLIEADYIRNTNEAGRDMLIATDTGKAANAGIMWASL